MASASVTIRMDETLKRQAETVFNEMGMNMTTAVTIFAKAVVRQGRIPFEIAVDRPNARTLAAMEEIESGNAKQFGSVQALFEDLNDDH